jgi:hypothetical protein
MGQSTLGRGDLTFLNTTLESATPKPVAGDLKFSTINPGFGDVLGVLSASPGPSPDPDPAPSSSSTPVGAIVGGILGGLSE